MSKKYYSIKDFVQAAINGEFKGFITVDNDSVYAQDQDGELICGFEGEVPENVLVKIFEVLGVQAERS